MRRVSGPVVALLSLAGCSTVIPLQTASTVPVGHFRVGGQATVTPYCSVTTTPAESCQSAPTAGPGAPPTYLPELRLNGRYGARAGVDVGASLHAIPAMDGAFRGGVFVDGKLEAFSAQTGGGRSLVSAGFGAGLTTGLSSATRPALTQVELALPLFFGWQMPTLEWVVSPRVIERLAFADVDGDGRRDVLPVTELGMTAGVFTRGTPSLFVQVGYTAPVAALGAGPWTVGIGAAFDGVPAGATPQRSGDRVE